MKKALAAVLAAVLLVPAIAFAADDKVIKVGVTPFPHKDIMEAARPLLEKEGYELKIVEFTDYPRLRKAPSTRTSSSTSPTSTTRTKSAASNASGSQKYTSSRWASTRRR